MKQNKKSFSLLFSALGILCLILDSKCASESATNAIDLCLKTVIPSLFPMFVLSGIVVSDLSGSRAAWMSAFESIARLPTGSGGIFLIGALGGFPVGAQCIGQAVSQNCLSRQDGERMLGYCNNCSPGFLFGILGSLFHTAAVPLLIWLIQLESALLIACFWPGQPGPAKEMSYQSISLTASVRRSVRSITNVCAWILLSSIMTGFLERWLFPVIPSPVPEIMEGLFELTGGILGTSKLGNDSLRLVLCALFTCFGGVCVLLQIHSIAAEYELSVKTCLQQKIVQGLVGALLGAGLIASGPLFLLIIPVLMLTGKIMVEKIRKNMYNSIRKGGY